MKASYSATTASIEIQDDRQSEVLEETYIPAYLIPTVFVICGITDLWFWSTLLNFMTDMQMLYFQDFQGISDSLTGVNQTASIIAIVMTLWRGNLSQALHVSFQIGLGLFSILMPVFCEELTGNGRLAAIHIVVVIIGFCAGGIQALHFSFAASMPTNATAWVCLGQGLQGLLSFALSLIFTKATSITVGLYVMMAISALLSAAASVLLYYTAGSYESVKSKIQHDRREGKLLKKDPDSPSVFGLIKLMPMPLVNIFLAFSLTYLVYPNIGPLRWPSMNPESSTQNLVLFGTWNAFSFVGRSLVTLLPALLWTERTNLYVIGAGLILIALSIILWQVPENGFTRNYGPQMVVLAITSLLQGQCSTVALVHAPQCMPDPRYCGRAAAVATVFILLGVSAGLWVCYGIVRI